MIYDNFFVCDAYIPDAWIIIGQKQVCVACLYCCFIASCPVKNDLSNEIVLSHNQSLVFSFLSLFSIGYNQFLVQVFHTHLSIWWYRPNSPFINTWEEWRETKTKLQFWLLNSQSLQKIIWGGEREREREERNHVLNLWVSFSTPSLQSPATFFAPSLRAKLNSAVLCCKSCADILAFEMTACCTSSARFPALLVHSLKFDINKAIFWMIMLIISVDFPLKSPAITFSLSIKFSALLTVPSTENGFPALSHETPAVVSSRRSSSTTTLMPCLSHRSLASSRAFACSLALFASSSAQALDDRNNKTH